MQSASLHAERLLFIRSLLPVRLHKEENEAGGGNVNDCKTATISYTADNNQSENPETVE